MYISIKIDNFKNLIKFNERFTAVPEASVLTERELAERGIS